MISTGGIIGEDQKKIFVDGSRRKERRNLHFRQDMQYINKYCDQKSLLGMSRIEKIIMPGGAGGVGRAFPTNALGSRFEPRILLYNPILCYAKWFCV